MIDDMFSDIDERQGSPLTAAELEAQMPPLRYFDITRADGTVLHEAAHKLGYVDGWLLMGMFSVVVENGKAYATQLFPRGYAPGTIRGYVETSEAFKGMKPTTKGN